ncbi:hypothetical protein QR98_0029710 [Sarcoptes scabiei]|uniref:Uncharacterized protein n=1 Tax=Sarcoptes scabiei TaxID=52283 RepID=A0A132A0A3_SARSC|nr:hypothetical protein QR98_0029710 [Sarcoptes scabiei]
MALSNELPPLTAALPMEFLPLKPYGSSINLDTFFVDHTHQHHHDHHQHQGESINHLIQPGDFHPEMILSDNRHHHQLNDMTHPRPEPVSHHLSIGPHKQQPDHIHLLNEEKKIYTDGGYESKTKTLVPIDTEVIPTKEIIKPLALDLNDHHSTIIDGHHFPHHRHHRQHHPLIIEDQHSHLSLEKIDYIPGIPGKPWKDYPIYSEIPKTSFKCNGSYGYFADVEAGCQVWHICQPDGRHDSFLCSNGTLFNQKARVCDWWHNVHCPSSIDNYNVNFDLYQPATMEILKSS